MRYTAEARAEALATLCDAEQRRSTLALVIVALAVTLLGCSPGAVLAQDNENSLFARMSLGLSALSDSSNLPGGGGFAVSGSLGYVVGDRIAVRSDVVYTSRVEFLATLTPSQKRKQLTVSVGAEWWIGRRLYEPESHRGLYVLTSAALAHREDLPPSETAWAPGVVGGLGAQMFRDLSFEVRFIRLFDVPRSVASTTTFTLTFGGP